MTTQWLWRMDAIHDVLEFSIVRFFATKELADAAIDKLEQLGWLCDSWVEEVPVMYFAALVNPESVWPMIDTWRICGSLDAAWTFLGNKRTA